MTGWGDKALPFLAVGRVKDGVTIAFHADAMTDEQKEQTHDVFKKLLTSGKQKLAAGQRIRLQWNDGSVCCFMDQQGALLYCAVTSLISYPERLAYQLLYDLVVAVQALRENAVESATENSLNAELGSKMRELVVMYEDPNNFPQLQNAIARASAGRDALGITTEAATSSARSSRTKMIVIFLLIVAVVGACIALALHHFGPDKNKAGDQDTTTTTTTVEMVNPVLTGNLVII